MNNIIEKPWGFTQLIFDNNTIHIYLANINKNQYCSKHYHKYKNNFFFLQSGSLIIRTWGDQDDDPVDHILNPKESIEIKAGIWHQFIAKEDSILIEIYSINLDHEDIIRHI